jgi:hypothetical protein
MGRFDDIDLDRQEVWQELQPDTNGRRIGVIAAVIAVALVAAGATWWFKMRTPAAPDGQAPAAAVAPAAQGAAIVREYPASNLPPLDALDPAFREIVGALTSSPLIGRWLATSDLARQLAALVAGATGQRLPLKLLAPLRPAGSFAILEQQGRTVIDPASYARYDRLADAIVALDPAAVARAYQTLGPRLEDATSELGEAGRTFDQSLGAALASVAQTPIPDGPIEVTPRGGVYAFADPRLEALTPLQKLLIRSGPANARRVQAHLAAIAAAMAPPAPATP